MLLRIAAIAGLVILGFSLGGNSPKSEPLLAPPFSLSFGKHWIRDGSHCVCLWRLADLDFCSR